MRLARILAPLAVAGLAFATWGGVASAHDHSVTATCAGGLSVSLTDYAAGSTNSVVVTFDGVVVASNASFGSAFSFTKPNPDKTVGHTWTVVVVAGDSSDFNVNASGTIPACEEPTTTTTKPRTPPPTVVPVPAPPIVAPPIFTG